MIAATLAALQTLSALRVLARLITTSGGISVARSDQPQTSCVSVLVPVLDEAERLPDCLASLVAQPEEVSEILVVDGGSRDGTRGIVDAYHRRDFRVRLVDAAPVNRYWTGKAWGLYVGFEHASKAAEFILCVDADARAHPALVRSLLAHASRTGDSAFSVATRQRLTEPLVAALHPALLSTLVYRFGIPGRATRNLHRVQANGQCFISRRATLARTGAIAAARGSLCEDVTIARRIAERGEAVGFYESAGLIDVEMYGSLREAWRNWPRSLPMRDRYFGWREAAGLIDLLLVQALPLPALLAALIRRMPRRFVLTNAALVLLRLGILTGTARAYRKRPWTYWLSPLCDLAAVLRLCECALRRRHHWRGRAYVRRPGGAFQPIEKPNER